jgi:hypothetical protein
MKMTLRVEMVTDVGNRRQWQWPVWNSLRGTDLTVKETRHNENFIGSMVFKHGRFKNN